MRVYRKTKPTDFANYCDAWGPGCVNARPNHASEHWVYLVLPFALAPDATYTLSFPGLNGREEVMWRQRPRALRSEAVHVNQVGYAPRAPEKFGYVYHWMGDGGGLRLDGAGGGGGAAREFQLVDTTSGAIAFRGQVAFRKPLDNQEFAYPSQSPPHGNLLGAEVWECDFSSFRQNGSYRLCVDGVGCSFPFEVDEAVLAPALDLLVEGIYQQRSGIATVAPFTSQPRPAPHRPGVTPGFAGRLKYSSIRGVDYADFNNPQSQKVEIVAAIRGPLESWGWYQDAGDWDSYFSHGAVAMHLLWLYESSPRAWTDGQLLLPERGNGLPDLLDEALWLPRFYHRLRAELTAKGYGTGGLGGARVFGDLLGSDAAPDGTLQGSWQDVNRDYIVSGEDPWMSYQYAGLAAEVAAVLAENDLTDPEGVDWSDEARGAYAWARANTRPGDEDLEFETPLRQARFFAAAQLYRLTGEAAFAKTASEAFASIRAKNDDLSNHLTFGLAGLRRAQDLHPDMDRTLVAEVREKIIQDGRFLLDAFRDRRAARWGGNWYLPLIIGQGTTPLVQAGILAHAYATTDDPAMARTYEAALYSTADYFLGNNPLNMAWVTGLGERSPAHVFALDAFVLAGETPRQGIVPYGPWTKEYLGFFGVNTGPWDPRWAFRYTYPAGEDAWPGHERWFEQRTAPLTSEYTIHQNQAPALLTYGYLHVLSGGAGATPVAETVVRAAAPDLRLSPNPTSNSVSIGGMDAPSIASVTVVDRVGRVVGEAGAWDGGALSLDGVAPGYYLVRVSLADGRSRTLGLVVE